MIKEAQNKSVARVEEVKKAITKFDDPQTSVVVTGSVARGEVTSGSDFDWMLLVDGASDPEHFTLTNAIADELQGLGIKKPGLLSYLASW